MSYIPPSGSAKSLTPLANREADHKWSVKDRQWALAIQRSIRGSTDQLKDQLAIIRRWDAAFFVVAKLAADVFLAPAHLLLALNVQRRGCKRQRVSALEARRLFAQLGPAADQWRTLMTSPLARASADRVLQRQRSEDAEAARQREAEDAERQTLQPVGP